MCRNDGENSGKNCKTIERLGENEKLVGARKVCICVKHVSFGVLGFETCALKKE